MICFKQALGSLGRVDAILQVATDLIGLEGDAAVPVKVWSKCLFTLCISNGLPQARKLVDHMVITLSHSSFCL